MRTSSLLLAAVPALVAADQAQVPLVDQLKGWFNKASASISSALPSAPSTIPIVNPVAAGAAQIASSRIERLTISNYKDVLRTEAGATATPGYDEWLILVTGGNKTCFGRCERAETAFNESIVLMAASRSPPSYGLLDCETQGPLCHAWATGAPSIMHMLLPQALPDQSAAGAIVRNIPVNRTSVVASDIAALHLEEKYKVFTPYEGFFHPFNGFLASNNLSVPFGYAFWGWSQIPSWVFMILVSFVSRRFVNRQFQPPQAQAQAPRAAAAPRQ